MTILERAGMLVACIALVGYGIGLHIAARRWIPSYRDDYDDPHKQS